jgi:hypothetical protein
MQATPWGFGSAMAVPQFIDTYDPADERLADTWLMGQQYAADGRPSKPPASPLSSPKTSRMACTREKPKASA